MTIKLTIVRNSDKIFFWSISEIYNKSSFFSTGIMTFDNVDKAPLPVNLIKDTLIKINPNNFFGAIHGKILKKHPRKRPLANS